MTDQSLREALEEIARGAVPIGTSPAKFAHDFLAAHPAEPAHEVADLAAALRASVEPTKAARIASQSAEPAPVEDASRPDQADVDAVRGLLDLMAGFESNDQRARYLLSSNWLRDRGAVASSRLAMGEG